MTEGLTPAQDAWLRAQYSREALENMSAAEINSMDLATFAKMTGRPTPTQTALRALNNQEPPQAPQSAPQAPESQPQGVDLSTLSMKQYAALRGQLGIGQGSHEGHGIFNSVSSRSEQYAEAARAHAGRTALGNANVVEPPRLTGRYVTPDKPPVYRSAQDRFSTPGNSFQG